MTVIPIATGMRAELPWVCDNGPCYSLACGAHWQACRQNGKLTESELDARIASHDYAHPTWRPESDWPQPMAAEAATRVVAESGNGTPPMMMLSRILVVAMLVANLVGFVGGYIAGSMQASTPVPTPAAKPARVLT